MSRHPINGSYPLSSVFISVNWSRRVGFAPASLAWTASILLELPLHFFLLTITRKSRLYHYPLQIKRIPRASTHLGVLPFGIVVTRSLQINVKLRSGLSM